jgi:octaprenyl-diphosphate synthase
LFEVIEKELKQVDHAIRKAIQADEKSLERVAGHVVGSGGKRVRPALVLLSYLAANGDKIRRAVPAAAAIEVIHTATLIHDDISDRSERRRGKPSAHVSFGVAKSLIAADYLMTAAFKLVGDYGIEFIRTINNACMNMAVGEIQDLRQSGNVKLSEKEYIEIVSRKTGSLMEAGVKLGVMLASGEPKEVKALGSYGLNVGIAFQIVDDVLDVSATAEELGKPVGKDIREGKITLTSIYAMEHLKGTDAKFLRAVLSNPRAVPARGDIKRAIAIVRKTGAEKEARAVAKVYADKARRALKGIPESVGRRELIAFADEVVQRRS